MNLIEKSLQIALQAHMGQTDKAGQAYILHPLRIMAQMNTEEEMSVALLHDVIEDSDSSAVTLLDADIPLTVVDAVECLTKLEGENYDQFIQRVLTNRLSATIKMADIEDNLQVLRLVSLSDADLERVRKYHAAWKTLESSLHS